MPSFRQLYADGRLSQYLLWLACLMGVTGLLAARALVAIAPVVGMVALFANPNLRRDLPNYFRNGAALRAAAMYALFVLSGLYTSEWPMWRHEVYRLLPWLGVPLAFTLAVPLRNWQRLAVGSYFVLGTAAVALGTLVKYFLDPAAANEAIRVGQNMASITRIFHIHFGVMLGLAFFFSSLLRREALAGPWLRRLLLLAAGIIIITLHVLAYRTGLLVLYVGLLIDALRLIWRRRIGLALGGLLVLAAGPWLAYKTLPSVHERVQGTLWDIGHFTHHQDINDFSLARRLAAWQTASTIISQHPILGVGPADAYAAMMAQYDWYSFGLRPANRAMVHNQYLHYMLGSGAVGLLLWLAVLLWPFTQPSQRRNPYIWHFLLVLGVAMFVDSLLELQIGFNLFVFGYGFLVVAGERYASRQPPL